MSFFGEQAFTAMKSSEAEMQDSSGSAADSDKKVIPDVPSEVMTKGIREEWVRKTKRALTTDQQVRAGRPLDGAAVVALLGRRMCAARALAARAAVARVAFGTTAAPGGRRVGRSAARRLHGVTLDAWHGSARDSEWCWQRGGCWPARQLVQPLTSLISLLLSALRRMVL